ncbi:U-scoloptoxin(18)-Er1a-like [Tachypleus tridentatus]|uniref:U-scoloptoxin(18)-Er1a-like n=1 Tax=Tachypleus tridentatus TaxID=6853 RepID=UPI003FD5C0B6
MNISKIEFLATACVVLLVFNVSCYKVDQSLVQKPIEDFPYLNDYRDIGTMCQYSSQCKSKCCLADSRTGTRTCQKMALKHERCSTGQIKFDSYAYFCPCESGNKYCEYPDYICKA